MREGCMGRASVATDRPDGVSVEADLTASIGLANSHAPTAELGTTTIDATLLTGTCNAMLPQKHKGLNMRTLLFAAEKANLHAPRHVTTCYVLNPSSTSRRCNLPLERALALCCHHRSRQGKRTAFFLSLSR